MRYFIGEGHPDAPADQPWALCNDEGPVQFCATREEALGLLLAQYDQATAAVEPAAEVNVTGDEVPWESDLMYVDVETSDHRIFHDVTNRALPLTLMYQFVTSWGHDGAEVAGRIDEIDPPAAGGLVKARGVFTTNLERGEECAQVVATQTVKGISVDLGGCEGYELEITEFDEEGWPIGWLEHYYGASIMGATVLPFPAFEECTIWITDTAAVAARTGATAAAVTTPPAATEPPPHRAGVVAVTAAAGDLTRPPRSWFEQPQLARREPLHVEDDGRVWGHVYGWGECHVGEQRYCLTAPPSPTGYAYMMTGAVLTAEGEVPTGVIHLDTDHATTSKLISWVDAKDHYAHTGLAAADCAFGDDEYGIWVAGAVRPGTAPEKVYALRASTPSVDYRTVGGRLDLVGLLAVNQGGYPSPRVFVASGKVLAITAAVGARPGQASHDCGCGGSHKVASLTDLEVATLRPLARDALLARIREDKVPA